MLKDEINRVRNIENEIESSLLEIKNHYKETYDVPEIRNFRDLLDNIKKETSSAHRRLADWKSEQNLGRHKHGSTVIESR